MFSLVAVCAASVAAQSANSIPPEFQDIPIYKGSRVISAGPILRTRPDLGRKLVVEASASVAEVNDFYEREMQKAGWRSVNSKTPGTRDWVFEDVQRVQVAVRAVRAGAKPVSRVEIVLLVR